MQRLVLYLGLIVAAGIPLAGYLWETLNQLLSGHVNVGRLAVSGPLLLAFLVVLGMGRRLFTRAAVRPEGAAEDPDVSGTLVLTALVIMFIFGVWVMMYYLLLNR